MTIYNWRIAKTSKTASSKLISNHHCNSYLPFPNMNFHNTVPVLAFLVHEDFNTDVSETIWNCSQIKLQPSNRTATTTSSARSAYHSPLTSWRRTPSRPKGSHLNGMPTDTSTPCRLARFCQANEANGCSRLSTSVFFQIQTNTRKDDEKWWTMPVWFSAFMDHHGSPAIPCLMQISLVYRALILLLFRNQLPAGASIYCKVQPMCCVGLKYYQVQDSFLTSLWDAWKRLK